MAVSGIEGGTTTVHCNSKVNLDSSKIKTGKEKLGYMAASRTRAAPRLFDLSPEVKKLLTIETFKVKRRHKRRQRLALFYFARTLH